MVWTAQGSRACARANRPPSLRFIGMTTETWEGSFGTGACFFDWACFMSSYQGECEGEGEGEGEGEAGGDGGSAPGRAPRLWVRCPSFWLPRLHRARFQVASMAVIDASSTSSPTLLVWLFVVPTGCCSALLKRSVLLPIGCSSFPRAL